MVVDRQDVTGWHNKNVWYHVGKKKNGGHWVHEANLKAIAFAYMVSHKFVLPADPDPEVSVVRTSPSQINGFVLICERRVRRELKNLRVDQATGPIEIPARLLIECASVLSRLLCRILRSIIAQRVWPQMSRFHRIAPLFKKGAVHKVAKYRSLHLTLVLSKVSQRVLKIHFVSESKSDEDKFNFKFITDNFKIATFLVFNRFMKNAQK